MSCQSTSASATSEGNYDRITIRNWRAHPCHRLRVVLDRASHSGGCGHHSCKRLRRGCARTYVKSRGYARAVSASVSRDGEPDRRTDGNAATHQGRTTLDTL